MLYSELNGLVHVIESKDYGSAGVDGDSVHMGRLHHIAMVLTFGAITGNSVLKFYQGATVGAKTTAIAFNYRTTQADFKTAATTQGSNADSFGSLVAVASTGLTMTAATFDHRLIVVEFDGVDLASGFPFLTLEIDSTATAMNVGCIGIARPRYTGNQAPTLL